MKSYEEYYNEKLARISNMEEVYGDRTTVIGNDIMDRLPNIKGNFSEFVRQLIARDARDFVESICIRGTDNLYLGDGTVPAAYNSFEIKPNDPILGDINYKGLYGTTLADELIQKIYESYGYTDKLPTKRQIDDLENELKSIPIVAESEKYYALSEEIELLKNRAGMKVNESLAICYTDEQIKQIYNNHFKTL